MLKRMDRAALKQLLEDAAASVAQGEQHLASQRALIADLESRRRTRGDAAAARTLLRTMEASQTLRVVRLEGLRRELEGGMRG